MPTMSSIKKSNSKPRPVYQLRRQCLLQKHREEQKQDTVATRSQRHLQEIVPAAAAAAAAVTHIPSVDDITNMCKFMMRQNHLSKEIVIPKGLDLDADGDDEVHVTGAKQQMPDRPLRRRSNSFHKLIKAFRLHDELVEDDDDEDEVDNQKKQDSLNFEPVHVPPPNHLNHHHHDKPDETKANHLHEAMLLSLVAKSRKFNAQSAPPANPFDSTDTFEKLHSCSSSMDSLCLDDLAAMAKMDIVQRETEREIRAHLDEERRCHTKGSQRHLHNGRDEHVHDHETAVLRATLQAYASHHASSTSCTIESISLTEFDGLIMPKSEVPIDVSSDHRHLWRPHNPTIHRKISASSA